MWHFVIKSKLIYIFKELFTNPNKYDQCARAIHSVSLLCPSCKIIEGSHSVAGAALCVVQNTAWYSTASEAAHGLIEAAWPSILNSGHFCVATSLGMLMRLAILKERAGLFHYACIVKESHWHDFWGSVSHWSRRCWSCLQCCLWNNGSTSNQRPWAVDFH